MNPHIIRKNNPISNYAILLFIFLAAFNPLNLSAQTDPQIILDQLDLIVNVNNIATHGEIALRGKVANFPNPIMSTISVVDSAGDIIIGLANTLRWLKPNDIAENGLTISQIWKPVLEYHEENNSFPPDPNIYNQLPEPEFTEVRWTEPIPTSTMLVMDVSSSMTEKLNDAKAAACLYVSLMRPVDRGGVVQFSRTVDLFQSMTGDTSLLKQIINNAAIKVGTALYDGIMAAIAGIKAEVSRRAVIVYTDGRENSSKSTLKAVVDSARAYNLPIYTIGLGNQTNDLVLRQIAESTGGIFFKAATAEEMKIIYGKLSVLMQNYYVMAYASPDPFFNHTWRLVDVTVNLPDLKGSGIGRYFVGGPPINLNTDVSARMTSITDTSIVIAGDSINAVKPGESFKYILTAKNLGPNLADTVKVIHFLPDSVQFLSASVPPKFGDADKLEWEFPGIVPQRELNISVNVQLNKNIPPTLTDLISVMKVSATNDTNRVNNFDADTVKVIFPELPQNYDLSLTQQVIPDTTIYLAGNEVPAVVAGNSYQCLLTISNFGPGTAYDFSLRDVLPDSVTLTNLTIPATIQTIDSLFWQFDSLANRGSIQIAFELVVADSLPSYPFPLINVSELVASNDTTPDNNSTTTTVYAIKKPEPILRLTDLAITLNSATHTKIYVNQDSVNAVFPGDNFSYLINVTNLGANPTDTVQVVQLLPDSVNFISASPQPKYSHNDSLNWEFYNFQPGEKQAISVNVKLADNVPKQLTELISQANLVGANDSTLSNNSAKDTVRVIFKAPQPQKNYDLSLSQTAITDTSIWFQGDSVKAVLQGDIYSYSLSITNSGPATAYHVTLWDVFPDSVMLSTFNSPPLRQTPDSLFWIFDSLTVGKSIHITFDAEVADSLPITPFPLVNRSGLIAQNDTLAENNFSVTTVYGIQKRQAEKPGATDIALKLVSLTDTTVVVDQKHYNAVKPGEKFQYLITIENNGPNSTDSLKLLQQLPDSVRFLSATLPAQILNRDSLFWEFDNVQPGAELKMVVSVQLPANVPKELSDLISNAFITAANDSTQNNNYTADTVKVLFSESLQNYDLSLTQQVIADTTIRLAGNEVPAVVAGDSYRCLLTVYNSGPGTAYNFSLRDTFPDFVTLSNFTIPVTSQTPDNLFWQIDALTVGDSIQIAFDIIVADTLPSYPFPLINVGELIASNDTTPDNNSTTTTVYGIQKKLPEKPGATDMALKLVSLTDTTVVVDQKTYNAVKPGEKFQYLITVENNGPNSADSLKLFQQLPNAIQFLDATLPAQILNRDSLLWEFATVQPGAELKITVSVQLSADVPKELHELISNASFTATNDSTPDNNFAADTVKVLFPESPISLNYNLATSQTVFTDTSIMISGETVPAVLRGDSYRYHLKVQNFGPATARNFKLWDVIPGLISILNISLSPVTQTQDSLFWQFNSLSKGDSIIIALDVSVAELLPYTPFPLVNETGIVAEHDTSAANNISTSLIYAIARSDEPQTFNSDIAVSQVVVTDSFAVAGNDTLRFARAGETYSYTISVSNVSLVAAQAVKVIDILPDSIAASNYQPLPELITDDSLVWSLGVLLPQTKAVLHFNATVASNMPVGKNFLINETKVIASNEDPTRLSNNQSIRTVINLVKPTWEWEPYIEALPQVVKVGNPISVRVKVTAPIEAWDLWLYLANGQIDSTYGDDFIATNPLVPDVWTTVDPAYSDTKLYTEAKKEEIIFELRARDVFGEIKTATATVTVESDDDLVIDQNVFIPDQEHELPIRFKLSSDRQVCLEIYDITGTKITNVTKGQFQAGWNTYAWNGLTDNGQKIGSGFYILTFRSGEYQAWKKLMIVR